MNRDSVNLPNLYQRLCGLSILSFSVISLNVANDLPILKDSQSPQNLSL